MADVAPTGLEIALAIGSDGVPQMVYVDAAQNQVITGLWLAGHWSLAPLTTAGHSLRLAVGQDNRPHLSLIQQGRLIYWTKPGGVWQSEPISPTGVTVGDAFLGLDSQGRPKVVYGGSGIEGLVVAVRQGAGQWTTESIPGRNMIAMALGPDDAVYLLHITTRFEPGKPPWEFISLWLVEQQGGNWQDSGLYEDLFMGTYPDGRLLFDAAGRLHIVNYGNGDRLYYHQRDVDGQWSSEGVANVGGALALAVGSDGQPRVSSQVRSDLRLYTRELLWLDQHALLPIIPVKSNTE